MPRPTIPDRAEALLDHARAVILEQGYRRATVAAIARRAGVAKGAVYLDFPSKEALLDALLVRSMRRMAASVRERVAAHGEAVTLSAAFRYGAEALLGDELMLAFYLGDAEVLGDYVRAKGPERYRLRLDWLTEYVVELRGAGLLRTDLDPREASLLMSVFTVGLINAAGALGPLTAGQLGRTVELMGELIATGWERPGDPGSPAVRRVYAALLDRLDEQLAAP
ncbi:TetR/AcrR family transcriptional regulator [Allonocardiopsis opalescens]|uniref:TetR family transcriptional regulator n=1 Tax=Allonocardiopsis opalescens TaxID=1144618 RepID=A0A2T0PYU4_9ACTN|nr:TetR/AcrR family transcriptional regulator [Allonocardiopsis opalescens]PRX96715.1 TetR family transcriptional regulator [Allonocardiopsis opalescens]